jgi:hypothetical protein
MRIIATITSGIVGLCHSQSNAEAKLPSAQHPDLYLLRALHVNCDLILSVRHAETVKWNQEMSCECAAY